MVVLRTDVHAIDELILRQSKKNRVIKVISKRSSLKLKRRRNDERRIAILVYSVEWEWRQMKKQKIIKFYNANKLEMPLKVPLLQKAIHKTIASIKPKIWIFVHRFVDNNWFGVQEFGIKHEMMDFNY